jgi:DNA-binding GntR family transcriptional regulator
MARAAVATARDGVDDPVLAAVPISATTRVAERLREEIRGGRLVPGNRLVEAELTGRFGVSRGPVREALSRLQSEGLVAIEPHRGASVRRLSRAELADLFWLRSRLSADAARLAAGRIEEGDNAELMRTELERQQALRGTGPTAYSAANVRFHELIDRLAGNAVLARVLRNLETHAGVFLHLSARASDTERLLDQHVVIAEAILRGDQRAAARASRKHGETVLRTVEELPDTWFD